MRDGTQLKYGPNKGADCAVMIPFPMGASEVVSAASGRFVKNDGSGRAEIAVDGTTLLLGWIEDGAQTCSTTEGGTVLNMIPGPACLGIVFRIPINAGTFVASMRGKTCDLAVSSSIQGAKLDGSGEDLLIIVDGDLVNNLWVDVMVAPDKLTGYTGVV